MDKKQILKQLADADKSDLNYFEILGTDRISDSQNSFPSRYFRYRQEWINRPLQNTPGDFPLHLDVESTNRCNLRCTMCQIDFDNMKPGNMAMSLYKRIIQECSENHLPSIKLNYRGEPTLNKNLVEMVKIAKDAGILEVQFNTNGTLLYETLAGDLIDAGLDRIKFSIDGATPEVYERIRGTDYYRVVNNVKSFVRIRNEKGKIRPIVHVQMVYMQDNKDEIVKFVNFWKNVANRIGFSRYRSTNRILEDKRRVEPFPIVTIPCPQLWQRLLITYDGTIVMCCGDQKIQLPLGSIKHSTIKKIWLSPQIRECRRLQLENQSYKIKICPTCELNKTDPKTARKIWKQTRKNS